MPVPAFIVELRRHIGHAPLFLIGVTAVVLRPAPPPAPGLEVLLVQRSDTGEWSPVTGIVDPGEEIADAAVREVAEEACVHAAVERLVWVSTPPAVTHVNGDQAQYVDHTLRLRWVSGEPRVGDDENLQARWCPVDQLPDMRPLFAQRIAVAVANEPACLLGPQP